MKLLFVENRYATWIWKEVAVALAADGHPIHWLVQNPAFAPSTGHVRVMPFPPPVPRSAERQASRPGYEKLSTDRGVRYFGNDDSHHAYYRREIAGAIDAIRPDVMFGEVTQFHEIIASTIARERGIPYFAPSATRYPPGRIMFQAYDTLEPVGGCGQGLTDEEALVLRDGILQRRVIPSYMTASPVPWHAAKRARIVDKLRIGGSWLRGERYVTPSPLRKAALERRHRRVVAHWDAHALAGVPPDLDEAGWLLYAMQVQPEANIDVWGYPWNDQTEIVRLLADSLQRVGGRLVVKPNPKSKYELSPTLSSLAQGHPAIVALKHSARMPDVFPRAAGVVSVTGTVTIESVLACKPVGVLGQHAMSRYPGVTPLESPSDAGAFLAAIREGKAAAASEREGAKLLSDLHAASYAGAIYDPLNQPHLASQRNHELIAEAFRHLLGIVLANS